MVALRRLAAALSVSVLPMAAFAIAPPVTRSTREARKTSHASAAQAALAAPFEARAPADRQAPSGPAQAVVAVPLVTLLNAHSLEAVAVFDAPSEPGLRRIFRCRVTARERDLDPALPALLVRVAEHFRASLIEVVSGFRDPKFNEGLRKKGHQVAQQSMHMQARAVDFRVPGTTTRKVRDYLLATHEGGVGYYPESDFVHADTGPRRTWIAR